MGDEHEGGSIFSLIFGGNTANGGNGSAPPPPPQRRKRRTKKKGSRRYRERPVFKEPGSKMNEVAEEVVESPTEKNGEEFRSIAIVENIRGELIKLASHDMEPVSAMMINEEEEYRSAVRARNMLDKNKDTFFDKRSIHNRIPTSPETTCAPKVHPRKAEEVDDLSVSFFEQPIVMKRDFSDLSQFLTDIGEKVGIIRVSRHPSLGPTSSLPVLTQESRTSADEEDEEDDILRESPDSSRD